jgi:hypothetical protein
MAKSDNPELRVVPLESATALAARFYTEPAVLELEREQVFARSWQLAAHAGELAQPGDHVACTLAGTPIVIVRGADGVLRAFHNVCRHRAGCRPTWWSRSASTAAGWCSITSTAPLARGSARRTKGSATKSRSRTSRSASGSSRKRARYGG